MVEKSKGEGGRGELVGLRIVRRREGVCGGFLGIRGFSSAWGDWLDNNDYLSNIYP